MKVYKFVFTIGLLNVLLPFIGIPGLYKQYIYAVSGATAILYALVVRTIQKEKESGLIQTETISYSGTENQSHSSSKTTQTGTPATRKIEEVVEMEESRAPKTSRIKVKRPTIKAKVVNSEDNQND